MKFNTKVTKIGSSLYSLLPNQICKSLNLKENDELNLEADYPPIRKIFEYLKSQKSEISLILLNGQLIKGQVHDCGNTSVTIMGDKCYVLDYLAIREFPSMGGAELTAPSNSDKIEANNG